MRDGCCCLFMWSMLWSHCCGISDHTRAVGWFCPYFKGQLFIVALNFTTQTVLLNGSSYNIYIYYEGWLLLSVYVVHALISLLWHFWPHAGCAIRGASAIYMGLTWVQGHGYLHGIADILAQSLFYRKLW